MNVKGTKKKNQVVTPNIFEQQELLKKAEVIRESLTASTWRELETHGKFDKNKKLSFISDDMYRSIYCHLDGYPEEVGKLLVKYYDTTEKLRELLALGDVYCLQKKLNPDPSALHCFGNYQKDVTVAFGRDREENGFEAKDRTLDEMLDSSEDPEFVYIFTAEQEWEFCHLYDYDVSFRKVRDVLSKESPGEEDAEPEKGQKDAPNLHI